MLLHKIRRLILSRRNSTLIIGFLVFLYLCSLKKSKSSRHDSFRIRGKKLKPKEVTTSQPKVSKPVVIARVLGNDLPPLHHEYQTYLNTKYILDREKLPDEYQKFWVVNCLESDEKVQNLTALLTRYEQQYQLVKCTNKSNPQKYMRDILKANKARNRAIRASFKKFNPNWVFVLDGSHFVTEQSLIPLKNVVQTQIPMLHFVASYRLLFKYLVDSRTKLRRNDTTCGTLAKKIGLKCQRKTVKISLKYQKFCFFFQNFAPEVLSCSIFSK